MKRSETESISLWHVLSDARLDLPKLNKNLETEICVIGAGIAGLTCAYILAKEGKNVVIVEACDLSAGETTRSSAHLTCILDDHFYKLESALGKAKTLLTYESHAASIDLIESIIKTEKIDCDFERVNGYLVSLTETQKKDFAKEIAALKRIKLPNHNLVNHLPIANIIDVGQALSFANQAVFDIAKYMNGLACAFLKIGGKIYVEARVNEIKNGENPYVKTENGFQINAKNIIIATNAPINSTTLQTKQAAYRSYAIAYEIPKNSYENFLLWDMADPYHYVRIVRSEKSDFLIAGGEDHKVGQENDAKKRYQKIDDWCKKHFKILGEIKFRWSGQLMEPMPLIGRNPGDKNIYIITGDSRNGITYSGIAGLLICDLIMGKKNPWQEIYDPKRKNLKSFHTLIDENINAFCFKIKIFFNSNEVSNINKIKNGEAAILRLANSKIAIYKNEPGKIYECLANCTHLGCDLQWNSAEKSWDCPYDGSRFDFEGKILNGPAVKNLAIKYQKFTKTTV